MSKPELCLKYRPARFQDVVGQKTALAMLSEFILRENLPHALLFSGPSGVGKTTLARIVAKRLGCAKTDLSEQNTADYRGIDSVRDIQSRLGLAPAFGRCRVWILDEVHQITGAAADALLKVLEEAPSHVYFMLCTTDPQKLKATIRTRCTEIKLQSLDHKSLVGLINTVTAAEELAISQDVTAKIAECANGSARQALTLLHQIAGLASEDEQLEAVERAEVAADGKNVARLLFKQTDWLTFVRALPAVIDDPEGLRMSVLGYAVAIMRDPKNSRKKELLEHAVNVIEAFRDNWYDCKASGLFSAAWQVLNR